MQRTAALIFLLLTPLLSFGKSPSKEDQEWLKNLVEQEKRKRAGLPPEKEKFREDPDNEHLSIPFFPLDEKWKLDVAHSFQSQKSYVWKNQSTDGPSQLSLTRRSAANLNELLAGKSKEAKAEIIALGESTASEAYCDETSTETTRVKEDERAIYVYAKNHCEHQSGSKTFRLTGSFLGSTYKYLLSVTWNTASPSYEETKKWQSKLQEVTLLPGKN